MPAFPKALVCRPVRGRPDAGGGAALSRLCSAPLGANALNREGGMLAANGSAHPPA
ncbi:hypothetical protein HMPREF0262_01531 [Clostridium sp. ATCC 29733]|nr:hypothetical protein HMPREF0262_01531 [Clostridium sp. ATCC 29733]